MGVKSTVNLTRDEAVDRLSSLYLEEVATLLRANVENMSDQAIESELERLNDNRCGGEGFENYSITEHREQEAR